MTRHHDLRGGVALITGAASGIGAALADALARRGSHLALVDIDVPGLEAVAARARSAGVRVSAHALDVADASAVAALPQAVLGAHGRVSVLVNNAGVGVGRPIADMPAEEWARLIDTNLTGVFHCCQAAIPHLRAAGVGWIVNLSSLAGRNPFPGGAAYCATKAGLDAFSEALMQELRYDGIRVAHVCPGSVATGFNGREATAGADWKLHPDDVARVIADLVAHPGRSLPSRIEIRPSQPPRK